MNKKLGLFRRIANKLNEENKILFYKSIIQPHVDYRSFLFKMMDLNTINQLQIIQNKCLRVINRENINELRVKHNIVLINTRINVNIVKTLNRILTKGKPNVLNKLIMVNNDKRISNLRFGNDLVVPNYIKKKSQKTFMFVATLEYNKIIRYISENKNEKNTFINDVINYYNK